MNNCVIGIDPSIAANGMCVLWDEKPAEYFTWGKPVQNRNKLKLHERLYSNTNSASMHYLKTLNPILVAVEMPISFSAGNRSMGNGFNNNIMNTGAIMSKLGEWCLPIIEVAPQQRSKYACGKASNKLAVCEAYHNYTNRKGTASNDNEIDAFWLAMIAAETAHTIFKIDFQPYNGWLHMPDSSYDVIEGFK